MNRRRSLLIGTGLVAGLLLASFAVLYLNGYLSQSGSRVSWESAIPHFATGLTAADGKAFVIDISGGIGAYDAANGNHIWGGSVGGYFAAGIAVGDGRVCGGTGYATVGGLDETTGQSLWGFSVPTDFGKVAPDSITVLDDRVVATARFGMGSSMAVHNATDGQLLWKAVQFPSNITNERDWWVSGYPLGGIPFEGNAIFAHGSDPLDPYVSTHIFKLDTSNGNILWRTNTTNGGAVLTNNKGQLVIQNDNLILGLNETSGSTVWTFDVGASTYQPTAIYGDLLILGAQNGNLYALHLSNGTLAWKTPFDSANLLALANAGNRLTLLPIQIDSESGKAFWSYGVTVVTGPADNLHASYTGYITSSDLKDGQHHVDAQNRGQRHPPKRLGSQQEHHFLNSRQRPLGFRQGDQQHSK